MEFQTDSIRLRPATYEDSDFAYGVMKSALGEYIEQTYGWDEAKQREIHNRRFRPSATWIVVYGGSDIGLLAVDRHPDHIHVRQLFIVPEAQGNGIGSQLMREIRSESDCCCLPVRLRVLKVNHRARDFYIRHEFSVVGETDTHYQMEYCPQEKHR